MSFLLITSNCMLVLRYACIVFNCLTSYEHIKDPHYVLIMFTYCCSEVDNPEAVYASADQATDHYVLPDDKNMAPNYAYIPKFVLFPPFFNDVL